MKKRMSMLCRLGMVVIVAVILPGCKARGVMGVEDAWARPGSSGGTSAVYLTINNRTGANDRLVGASSPAAGTAEIHLSEMDPGGMMRMTRQDAVDIPSGKKVIFEAGGLHVMLTDLKADLLEGASLDLSLDFEKAGKMTIKVPVRQP